MAAKRGFKDLLLEKGEKIALIGGGIVAALLIVWGVSTMASAGSPDETIKGFKAHKTRIETATRSEGKEADPLPEWVVALKEKKGPTPISPQQFPIVGPTFEPVATPDLLRANPEVLGISAAQMDYIQAPMVSLDLTDDDPPMIGVVVTTPKGELKKPADLMKIAGIIDKVRHQKTQPRFTPKKAPPKKNSPFPMGIGGSPPMVGGAGMPPEGAMMPMGDMAGYDPSNPYGSMESGMMTSQRAGLDKTVKYISIQEFQKSPGFPPAQTVYPLRTVVVQAAFPVKAQAAEIRRALRLPDPNRPGGMGAGMTGADPRSPMGSGSLPFAAPPVPVGGSPATPMGSGSMTSTQGVPSAQPYFMGFQVERQKINPKINVPLEEVPWEPFNHEQIYHSEIRRRAVATMPEEVQLLPFIRPGQRLAAPYPVLADKLGDYPNFTLKPIVDEVEKLRTIYTPKLQPGEWEKRFGNLGAGDDPYAPITTGLYQGQVDATGMGMVNPMGSGSGPTPFPMFPGANPMFPGAVPPGSEGSFDPTGGQMPGLPEIENALLRFFDPTVQPGYEYRYRVRVVMYNPNYVAGAEDEKIRRDRGLDKILRQPTDAAQRELFGPWVIIPQKISIPTESFLYAYDAGKYVEKALDFIRDHGNERNIDRLTEQREVRDGKKAVVQVQTWMPSVRIDGTNKHEPVGSWVVAEIPVGRGEYVGRRQIVSLPFWSAGLQNYVLRELAGGVKVRGVTDQNNQPKGWPINFRTKSVLVDFDGGLAKTVINGKTYEDESETDLLILRPDGKLVVRSTAQDTESAARKQRDTVWTEWIERVKARKDVTTNPMDPMGSTGFERKP